MLYLKEEKNCKMRKRREEKKKKLHERNCGGKVEKMSFIHTLGALGGWLIGGRKESLDRPFILQCINSMRISGKKVQNEEWRVPVSCNGGMIVSIGSCSTTFNRANVHRKTQFCCESPSGRPDRKS